MKQATAPLCLFLDIGGVLLTDGWDHHHASRKTRERREEQALRMENGFRIGDSAGYHARLACGHCARKDQMGKIGRGVYP